MKRSFCILLMFAALILAGGRAPSALPALGEGVAIVQLRMPAQIGAEDRGRRLPSPERNILGERKPRKGIGAEFWGGPYWGYGPRWGHPCQTCRAECQSDEDSARCERCRQRCGW